LHGESASANLSTARPGEIVSLIASASGEGFRFSHWEALSDNVSIVNAQWPTQAWFRMPYGNVSVRAVFIRVGSDPALLPKLGVQSSIEMELYT